MVGVKGEVRPGWTPDSGKEAPLREQLGAKAFSPTDACIKPEPESKNPFLLSVTIIKSVTNILFFLLCMCHVHKIWLWAVDDRLWACLVPNKSPIYKLKSEIID